MGKKKKKRREKIPAETPAPPSAGGGLPGKKILVACFLAAVALGTFLRFYDLERKPLHHDEGVNAFFLLNLKRGFQEGTPVSQPQDITPDWLAWATPIADSLDEITDWSWNHGFHGWKYDPSNYHGPFLFLLHIIPLAIEESDFTIRVMIAIFGSLLPLLLWPLRKKMGRLAVVAAAFILAISTINLYFARTNIHETYLVFFTLGTVAAAVRWRETGRKGYLLWTLACLGFIITIKETYIITFAAWVLALAALWAWFEVTRRPKEVPPRRIKDEVVSWIKANRGACWLGLGLFVFIVVIFYSSVFTNWRGATVDQINTLLKWIRTGTEGEGHEKEFLYYYGLLRTFELPVLLMGAAGILSAFQRRNPLMVFTAFWTLFIFLIYSSVPYKTPWLALNFILPLILLSGYFLESLYLRIAHSVGLRISLIGLTALALASWGYNTSWLVNFVEYDHDRHQIVYAQTVRDTMDLLERLEDYAHNQAQGYDTLINIIADEYWPLNWYLRDYRTAFWGRVIPEPDAPIIIGRTTTEHRLDANLRDTYAKEYYRLRGGVDLVLYTRTARGRVAEVETEIGDPRERPENLRPGLMANYYEGARWSGRPRITRAEETVEFEFHGPDPKPLDPPFSITWEGWIEIPESGIYVFATASDDGSWIYIDEHLVVDNGGVHAVRHVAETVELEAGFYPIRVPYFCAGGGAIMRLLWTRPGGSEEVIPARFLHHQP